MTTLILIKITDSKKEAMLNAIRHLKQAVLHMNPNEVLTNLSVDFSLLEKNKNKQAKLLISRLQRGNLLHHDAEIMFLSKWPKLIQRIFLSKERYCIF
jgi:hypothetical protein